MDNKTTFQDKSHAGSGPINRREAFRLAGTGALASIGVAGFAIPAIAQKGDAMKNETISAELIKVWQEFEAARDAANIASLECDQADTRYAEFREHQLSRRENAFIPLIMFDDVAPAEILDRLDNMDVEGIIQGYDYDAQLRYSLLLDSLRGSTGLGGSTTPHSMMRTGTIPEHRLMIFNWREMETPKINIITAYETWRKAEPVADGHSKITDKQIDQSMEHALATLKLAQSREAEFEIKAGKPQLLEKQQKCDEAYSQAADNRDDTAKRLFMFPARSVADIHAKGRYLASFVDHFGTGTFSEIELLEALIQSMKSAV